MNDDAVVFLAENDVRRHDGPDVSDTLHALRFRVTSLVEHERERGKNYDDDNHHEQLGDCET